MFQPLKKEINKLKEWQPIATPSLNRLLALLDSLEKVNAKEAEAVVSFPDPFAYHNSVHYGEVPVYDREQMVDMFNMGKKCGADKIKSRLEEEMYDITIGIGEPVGVYEFCEQMLSFIKNL